MIELSIMSNRPALNNQNVHLHTDPVSSYMYIDVNVCISLVFDSKNVCVINAIITLHKPGA